MAKPITDAIYVMANRMYEATGVKPTKVTIGLRIRDALIKEIPATLETRYDFEIAGLKFETVLMPEMLISIS